MGESKRMKAGVVTFPGSNCDEDVSYVLEKLCEFQVDRLWHKDSTSLTGHDLIVLPGGFSYGDYLRCGAMASLSPIMEQVKAFAGRGGMVLGICNGFQILCEAGLLPGALARNESLNFVCRDVLLRTETAETPWTRDMKAGEVVRIPIAHGEGRYVASEADYEKLKTNGQILFTYCDAKGKPTKEANPNGSVHNIAGVCNEAKNVFGLMPHPERATDLRSREGMKLWKSVVKTLQEKRAS